MNREQVVADLIEAAIRSRRSIPADKLARDILDAILPQVTTVEELEALPTGTILVGTDDEGSTWAIHLRRERYTYTNGRHEFSSARVIRETAPLTVVWQP